MYGAKGAIIASKGEKLRHPGTTWLWGVLAGEKDLTNKNPAPKTKGKNLRIKPKLRRIKTPIRCY